MDIFSLFATDAKSEEKGRAFTKEFGGKSTFIIARSGNRSYTRDIQAQFEAHRHTLELKDTPEQQQESDDLSFKIMGEVMARTILLGWSGEVSYKGVPVEYSYENAVMLLKHKEFRAKINQLADDYRKFLVEAQEKDEKNSVTSSAGSSPGVEGSKD